MENAFSLGHFDLFIDDDEGTQDALVTNQNLIDTQERLGALLDLMPTGLVIHQMQGILYANQQALKLFKRDGDAIVGSHILDYLPDEQREKVMPLFMEAFSNLQPIKLPDLTLRYPGAETYHLKVTAGHLPWEGTPVIQILLEDVSELKQQAEELRNLTLHDPLTGAYNRRYFIKYAEQEIRKAHQEGRYFSLLVFDLDHFKQINDTFGHLAGDEALKSIVQVWSANTRHSLDGERKEDGTLARIGGEEFAILLENTDKMEAKIVAERIREKFAENTVQYDTLEFKISASFGVTTLLPSDKNIDDLIRRADVALYRAKGSGRNRVEVT